MAVKGDRVELIRSNDPHTRLAPGEQGTVTFVDGLGTVHVQWDGGSTLGLVREDGDAWRVLRPRPDYDPHVDYPERYREGPI